MNPKNKLNPFGAPWSVKKDAVSSWHSIVDKDKTPVAVAYTPADAEALAILPELYADLKEAAYEYCFSCMEARSVPILDSHEVVEKGCPLDEGRCFVQRWLKTLKKIHRAYAKNNHEPKKGKKNEHNRTVRRSNH